MHRRKVTVPKRTLPHDERLVASRVVGPGTRSGHLPIESQTADKSAVVLNEDARSRNKSASKIKHRRWRGREPRGDQAARAAAEEGLTFTKAGARLGVSPQAVQQAWQRLFPGQDPPRKSRSARISEMLRAGRPISEVAGEVGLSEEHVRSVAQRSDIKIPSKSVLRATKFQEKFEQAMTAIAAGASISKAARDHGMSHGSLSRAMARRRLAAQESPPGDEPKPKSATKARRPYTAADVLVEERGGIVYVYGFADGEDAPIREVFRCAELPQRAGEHRATESNLFNARCRIAAAINRRNRSRRICT